ncbi:MAG: DUF72 domain-containing protein [Thermoprotei archaeon]
MKTLKIGCCGFPVSRSKYYSVLNVVELQNTFYELPSEEWFNKIRSEAPENFEFTIKAWQVITHPSTSPTWKKMKKKPGGDLNNYGYLKPTRENIEAFEKIVNAAHILKSRIIILQTPASMPFSDEVIKWVSEFFEQARSLIDKNMIIGWEPRGKWADERDILKRILAKYEILHVVDLFRREPAHLVNGILYTRLHGIGSGEVNYKYKYTREDFDKLLGFLDKYNFNVAYIMFNNVYMFNDAVALKEFVAKTGKYKIG